MYYYILLSTATIVTILSFIYQRKHLLMCLLCLESAILLLVSFVVFSMGTSPINSSFLFIILLTFGACEASLGLSLLVSMTRNFGNNLINNLTINKC